MLKELGEATEKGFTVEPEYSEDEVKYRSFLVKRIQAAKNKRDMSYPEFNDMTYQQNWVTNAKASNSYIRPKNNKQDTRVVTGTTEEKTNTIISAALNNNFQPNVLAYDKDNLPLVELGRVMEDMIKKSREIENPSYEEARIAIYKEFFDQGTVFVEDRNLEWRVPVKKLNSMDWNDVENIKNLTWSTKYETHKMIQVNLITGLNVYLGSMRELYLENQPYVFTREVLSRIEVQAVYGRWQRWKNVPLTFKSVFDTDDMVKAYNDFSGEEANARTPGDEMVEVIKYQDKWNNEYMVMVNGVMMLPIRFPLSALMGIADYTLAKAVAYPISRNFAYGKSVASKTKVEQQVFDELLRLLVLKSQQSFQPPFANNTGKIVSREVFFPGKITPDIDTNKFKPLMDATGVSNSELNGLNFIKSIIDGKSVNPILEGQTQPGEQTAREILELKQQSIQKLGLPILGIINLEQRLSWLRLINILQHWMSPIDRKPNKLTGAIDETFKTITVDTEFENGEQGQRIIEMMTGKMPEPEQVMAEEELLTRKFTKPTRKVYLNPKRIKQVVHTWFIKVVPTPKETTELERALFNETLQSGYALFGMEAFNQAHIRQVWATLNRQDPQKVFVQQQPQMTPPMAGQGEGQASNISQQIGMGSQPQRPARQQKGLKELMGA